MGLNEIEEKERDRRDCTRQKRQNEIQYIEKKINIKILIEGDRIE